MKLASISIDKEVLSGAPVFTGTRVPVQSLFDWLETDTLDHFLENFPGVKREHAVEVLQQAEKLLIEKEVAENENIAG